MIKKYFILSFAILIFYSCALNSSFSDNEDESTLSNGQEDSSLNMLESILEDKTFIIDSYPIPGKVKISKEESKTQRPKQLFSAAAKNEIRLHKLGEVRWVYMGIEPSSIWPRVIGYIETNNNLELAKADASLGIISSESFKFNGQDTKIEFKIEPGLQQSSSEIFVSHLVNRNGSWEIIPNINSNLEVVVNELYDYLSSSSPTSGTSLLALNLNTSNKTEVLVNDSGLKEIKLKVNFARAWASTRRSLLLAGFNIGFTCIRKSSGFISSNFGILSSVSNIYFCRVFLFTLFSYPTNRYSFVTKHKTMLIAPISKSCLTTFVYFCIAIAKNKSNV